MRHEAAIMKILLSALVTVALSYPVLAAGIDPALLALAAPDAGTLAGIQVIQAQSTPLGQALISQIQLDPGANRAMAAIGFDPRRDLREILVTFGAAGSGNLMSLGRGSFHPDKFAAAAASSGAALSTYRGVQIIEAKGTGQGTGADPSGSMAFLDASTMLAGNTASLKAALDRHAAGAGFSGPLADRARQIAAANDVWLVTLPPPPGSPPAAALGAQLGPLGNLLQTALQLSAGLKFTATDVTLSADVLTRSPQDAQSLVDVLKFAVQMLQPNRPPGGNAPAGPSLADTARISTAGSTLHLVVSVPQQQLQQFFFPAANPPKKLAAR
jgi:hypothetical protein